MKYFDFSCYNFTSSKKKGLDTMPDILFNNEKHHYLKSKNKYQGRYCKQKICSVTKKEFKEGDDVTMLINNNGLFSNRLVLTEAINKLGEEETVLYLAQRYRDYLKMREEFAEWLQ